MVFLYDPGYFTVNTKQYFSEEVSVDFKGSQEKTRLLIRKEEVLSVIHPG